MLIAVHGESDSIPCISLFQREHQVIGIDTHPPHSKVMFGEYLRDAGNMFMR